MIREAIILAGGFGTRLQSVVKDVPKPMAPVAGKPFLTYLLDYLISQKIEKVVLSVGYLADEIINTYGEQYQGLELIYSVEEIPLGTGGAIKKSLDLCSDQFVFILNGDSFFDVDLSQMFRQHQSKGAEVTFGLKEMFDFDRYGSVELNDETNQVLAFKEKERLDNGLINTGTYIFNRNIFDDLNLPNKFSLEDQFFQPQAQNMNFMGFISDSYFIDIGIPEDYERAQIYFSN